MCVFMCVFSMSVCASIMWFVVCPQLRSRVVVVKYDRKPLSNKTLFAFAEPFGCLREHLVLKNKVDQHIQHLQLSSNLTSSH